jgi:phosphoribosylanthranilate isomerase
MYIKICGLFREQDIDYVNEARPDYAGFVFAPSKRQVSGELARELRSHLADGIVPVGVFVNAPVEEIAALYHDGIISIAQLHGDEDESYITTLKEICDIKIIKVIRADKGSREQGAGSADYLLIDSGAGSGKSFDWDSLKQELRESPSSPYSLLPIPYSLPWFLAGGINLDNIEQAIALHPYALDISSGAETDGYKDREKIVQLVTIIKKGNIE